MTDSKLLYDHCTLNYFVESDTSSPNVLIFAEYEVEFLKPQVNINSVPSSKIYYASWNIDSTGTTYNVEPTSMAGVIPGTVAGTIQVPLSGTYIVTLSASASIGGNYLEYRGSSNKRSDESAGTMTIVDMTVIDDLVVGTNYSFLEISGGTMRGSVVPSLI